MTDDDDKYNDLQPRLSPEQKAFFKRIADETNAHIRGIPSDPLGVKERAEERRAKDLEQIKQLQERRAKDLAELQKLDYFREQITRTGKPPPPAPEPPIPCEATPQPPVEASEQAGPPLPPRVEPGPQETAPPPEPPAVPLLSEQSETLPGPEVALKTEKAKKDMRKVWAQNYIEANKADLASQYSRIGEAAEAINNIMRGIPEVGAYENFRAIEPFLSEQNIFPPTRKK